MPHCIGRRSPCPRGGCRIQAPRYDTEGRTQQSPPAAPPSRGCCAAVQRSLTMAEGAGRTTVILQSKGKDGAWAAATWGESDGGKSWMRLSAYGLKTAPAVKEYHAWIVPRTGDPMLVGAPDCADG